MESLFFLIAWIIYGVYVANLEKDFCDNNADLFFLYCGCISGAGVIFIVRAVYGVFRKWK